MCRNLRYLGSVTTIVREEYYVSYAVYLFCYYNHAAVFLINITDMGNRYSETNNK